MRKSAAVMEKGLESSRESQGMEQESQRLGKLKDVEVWEFGCNWPP